MILPDVPLQGFWYFILLAAAMIAWRIWGDRVRHAFAEMERKRKAAELQSMYDRSNPNSHFRLSVEQINEDTPPVLPIQGEEPGFSWDGQAFFIRVKRRKQHGGSTCSPRREASTRNSTGAFGNRISRQRNPGSLNGGPD
jgi:hypothetical protein